MQVQEEVVRTLPGVVEAAAKSPLGLMALMVIAIAALGYAFFKDVSPRLRVAMFLVMFAGVAGFGFAVSRTVGSSGASSGPEEQTRVPPGNGLADSGNPAGRAGANSDSRSSAESSVVQAKVSDQEQAVSKKAPSSDVDRPMPLAVGEVVKGRLASKDDGGKSHYWLVSLSPGTYKIIVDIRRADTRDSNVGGELEWLSPEGQRIDRVGTVNAIDDRQRGVFALTLKANLKAVLRYSNSYTVSDYWLGVFEGNTVVPVPFFTMRPTVQPVKLGETMTVLLRGESTDGRDACYSIRLAAGDYRFATEYRREDGRNSNVGGHLSLLDTDGQIRKQLSDANDIDVFTRKIGTLSLADEITAIFRVRAYYTTESVTLRVERSNE